MRADGDQVRLLLVGKRQGGGGGRFPAPDVRFDPCLAGGAALQQVAEHRGRLRLEVAERLLLVLRQHHAHRFGEALRRGHDVEQMHGRLEAPAPSESLLDRLLGALGEVRAGHDGFYLKHRERRGRKGNLVGSE